MGKKIVKDTDKAAYIIKILFESKNKERIEEIFKKYKIADLSERTELLRKCMQIKTLSNILTYLTPEEVYEDEIEMFIDGSWRFLTKSQNQNNEVKMQAGK